MKCRLVPEPALQVTGRVRHLCPGTSDVDFLRDLKRVVDLASVAHSAFEPGTAEKRLDPRKFRVRR